MEYDKNKVWFPAKTFGWGWGLPICWQGWVVLALYLVLLPFGAAQLNFEWRAVYVFFLSAGFIFVCWLKGEKPSWRWGKR